MFLGRVHGIAVQSGAMGELPGGLTVPLDLDGG